jgi:hypothetical protein
MSLTVQFVKPEFVHIVWPDVKVFLESALEHSAGEYTAEQLKVLIVRGEQVLLVAASESDGIKGAATVQFIDYANYRVAFITAIGGRLIAKPETFEQLVDFCRANGASKIQGAARESIERLWKRLYNFERRYAIVEKDI